MRFFSLSSLLLYFSPLYDRNEAKAWVKASQGGVITFILIAVSFFSPIVSSAQDRVPYSLPPTEDLLRLRSALLITEKGKIVIELFPDKAPWHVANFKFLADQDFYDGIRFHIHRPGKIIQGGTPRADNPDAGPGYTLPPEFSDLTHQRGTIGMARKPDVMNRQRNSHGSQFHILLKNASRMDGSFTVFGKVIKGMDVADSLRKGDRIKDLIVYVKPTTTKGKITPKVPK